MEIVWERGNVTVRDVLNSFKNSKKPAYTTIMTVMARLYDKGVLKRKAKNDAYIYSPARDKQSFFTFVSKRIINGLIDQFGEDVAVAGFVDIITDSNIKKSKELRKKLEQVIK